MARIIVVVVIVVIITITITINLPWIDSYMTIELLREDGHDLSCFVQECRDMLAQIGEPELMYDVYDVFMCFELFGDMLSSRAC